MNTKSKINHSLLLEGFLEDVINHETKVAILEFIKDEPETNFKKRRKRLKRSNSSLLNETSIKRFKMDEFKEHFRMSRTSFECLLAVVIRKVDTLEEPIQNISMENKLLFTIWLLSTTESFKSVGTRFGISNSSGHSIFQFMTYTLATLVPEYVKWPNSTEERTIAQAFKDKSNGIPGIVGVIDCCHIPIKRPDESDSKHYNRKQFHSIIVQGVCDHRGVFTDVFIGKPGSTHNSRVYTESPLYKKITKTPPLMTKEFHIIGDSAYPLSINMLTPYNSGNNLSGAERKFNTELSSLRTIIEWSFALLKGKFHRIRNLDIKSPEMANYIIGASCLLHNFILGSGEPDVWQLSEEDASHDERVDCEAVHYEEPPEAIRKRDKIKRLL